MITQDLGMHVHIVLLPRPGSADPTDLVLPRELEDVLGRIGQVYGES